jgi:uncharacterized protein (DUF58 family)
MQRWRSSRFFLGEAASSLSVELNQRRIFILPTMQGLGFVLLITLILVIAFVYNNNLAYMLAFLLASIFFITILHTYRCLSGLILRKGRTQPVFAGAAADFTLHILNQSAHQRVNLQFSIARIVQQQATISAHSSQQISLHSVPQKRGWHDLPTVTLSCLFPLGLFRAWSPVNFAFKTLVYPKPANTDLLFPEHSSGADLCGTVSTGSDDFYGLNEYRPGDALRQIHWKTYAKGQGLYSKQYSGSQAAELWFDFDCTPGGDQEQRLSQLCRWILDAELAGIRYGLILGGVKFAADSGLTHRNQCLEALALF